MVFILNKNLVLGHGVALIGMGMDETKITYPISSQPLIRMHSGATLKKIHFERDKFVVNLCVVFISSLGSLIVIESCKFEGGINSIAVIPSTVYNVHIKVKFISLFR